ncbi:MAG: septum site-determining protein MinC [Bacillota bacterium]
MGKKLNFKGVKEGIILDIPKKLEFDQIKKILNQKSNKKNNLLKNANLVGIKGKKLTYKEKYLLEEILTNLFKIKVLNLENMEYNERIEDKQENKKNDNQLITIDKTLRSGEEIVSKGDIVILGDVNPGAVLKSNGNIIVMGKLRGIAHAGINGKDGAYIVANKLIPNQLRINEIISRAPDDMKKNEVLSPEKAYINDGRIVIEPI